MGRNKRGGGWASIRYGLRMARQSGGWLRFYRALRSRNACKTCALGMGGQLGGMVDEAGHFPEVCKKSMQAMAADMRGKIAPEFFARYGFDALRRFSPRELEAMGRLVTPVLAGPQDTHFRPIAWEDALARCVRKLKETPPDRNFFYVSGRSSNEAGFLLQLFARIYGTNNVNNCSYYCHQASGVALSGSLGTGTATVTLEDLEHCDLFFLIGGNPASNHPRLMRALMKLRRRGGQAVVINPLVEFGLVNFSVPSDVRSLLFGSPIASLYVQPHIGGDIALLLGVAKQLEAMGAVESGFIGQCTEDVEAFRASLQGCAWQTIVAESGVERDTIERIAEIYARSERAVFGWTMGITHHLHGCDNVRAIVNLALLRGMVGKRGAGLLPIRGHSNVQGIGSMGVTPHLKQAVFERLQSHFGVRLPTSEGMDTLSCLEAMRDGRIDSAWCLGGNLFGASPDAKSTARSFGRLASVVYLTTTLNTGHAWGRAGETIILPVRARDEEDQPTTQESMFNFVRLSDGGPQRYEGPRGEVEVIAALAHAVLGRMGPIDWNTLSRHRDIRQLIAAVVPGYEALASIDQAGREFQIPGRTYHRARFATPTGRARFCIVNVPRVERPEGSLRLMTLRSEGQFNTVVYEDEDEYRRQDRRDVILMNKSDMVRRGLCENQPVVVRSATGVMHGILVRVFNIRAGNAAMYFPEANVLVSTAADPESRTPAFKSVSVTVEPDTSSTARSREVPVALTVARRDLHAC